MPLLLHRPRTGLRCAETVYIRTFAALVAASRGGGRYPSVAMLPPAGARPKCFGRCLHRHSKVDGKQDTMQGSHRLRGSDSCERPSVAPIRTYQIYAPSQDSGHIIYVEEPCRPAGSPVLGSLILCRSLGSHMSSSPVRTERPRLRSRRGSPRHFALSATAYVDLSAASGLQPWASTEPVIEVCLHPPAAKDAWQHHCS